jgi:hypothetical protein
MTDGDEVANRIVFFKKTYDCRNLIFWPESQGRVRCHTAKLEPNRRVSIYDVPLLLSAYQDKIPARNTIYAHAQDFAASDELLLAILKAFIPQPLNKQQTIGFHMF